MKKRSSLYTKLTETYLEITGQDELPPEVARKLYEISLARSESTKDPLEMIPVAMLSDVMESFDMSGHYPIPVHIGNGGELTDKDLVISFSKKNRCGYFRQENEICGLDGRLCLYDSQSFQYCPRYKEGINRKTPGYNGKVPEDPALLRTDKSQGDDASDPFETPVRKS